MATSPTHWVQFSKAEALKLNRLLYQEERNREYARLRYQFVHGSELRPQKSLELLRPMLAVHRTSGQSYWLPADDAWLSCDESQWALWFCVTDALASDLRHLIERDSRRLERAKARYAEQHPERKRPQSERLLQQLGAGGC